MLLTVLLASCAAMVPPQQLLSQPRAAASKPSISIFHAVQRIAVADIARFACGELCTLSSRGVSGRLEEALGKAHAWARAREPIVRWAIMKWVEQQVARAPNVPWLPTAARFRKGPESNE